MSNFGTLYYYRDMHSRRRNFNIIVIVLVCTVLVSANPRFSFGGGRKYQLTWSEDFDSSDIDSRFWSFMTRRESDAGRYFTNHSESYRLQDGYLRLYAIRNQAVAPDDTARVLTCGIETRHKKTISFGKVEVRARIHGAKGAWPAIWLRGDEEKYETYPDYAEIDIMEHLNYDGIAYQTVHTNYTDILKHHRRPNYSVKPEVDPEEFNVYAVEIQPNRIIFSINGERTMRYPRKRSVSQGQYPFGCSMHLMLDMQYGGEWVGECDLSTLPAYMDIDWVKFYE